MSEKDSKESKKSSRELGQKSGKGTEVLSKAIGRKKDDDD